MIFSKVAFIPLLKKVSTSAEPMIIKSTLLASALTGVISQKLVRTLCPDCRKLEPTTDYEKEVFRRIIGGARMKIEKANLLNRCSEANCFNPSSQKIIFEPIEGITTTVFLCEKCTTKLIEGLRQIGAVL